MGTFRQRMEVGDVQQDHFEIVDAWVDSGATYMWLPRELLRKLGHTPTFHRQFQLETGDVIERDLCWVTIQLHEETQPTPCVFGDEGHGARDVQPGRRPSKSHVDSRVVQSAGSVATLTTAT